MNRMDTLRNYLNGVLMPYQDTEELHQLRERLLVDMEDKFRALRADGKSESEAIGIVISEFGDVDELMREARIERGEAGEPAFTPEYRVFEYLTWARKNARQIGIATGLVIISPSLTMFDAAMGVLFLLLCVALAVGLYVHAGMAGGQTRAIARGARLSKEGRALVRQEQQVNEPKFRGAIVLAVCLCILSVVPVSALGISHYYGGVGLGVVLLFWMIAAAVYLFIAAGSMRAAYTRLLRRSERA